MNAEAARGKVRFFAQVPLIPEMKRASEGENGGTREKASLTGQIGVPLSCPTTVPQELGNPEQDERDSAMMPNGIPG